MIPKQDLATIEPRNDEANHISASIISDRNHSDRKPILMNVVVTEKTIVFLAEAEEAVYSTDAEPGRLSVTAVVCQQEVSIIVRKHRAETHLEVRHILLCGGAMVTKRLDGWRHDASWRNVQVKRRQTARAKPCRRGVGLNAMLGLIACPLRTNFVDTKAPAIDDARRVMRQAHDS